MLCAHLDTVPHDGRRSSRCSSTAAGRARATRSSAPTTRRPSRCCSRWRTAPRSRARPSVSSCSSRSARRTASTAPGSSTSRRCAPTSATSSTTRRRSARSSSPRRPSTACTRPSAAPRRTPASGPRTGAARSSPPRGRSPRCRHGRIDEETTANVGTIDGGAGGTNVVPERCWFDAEARSLSDAAVETLVAEMVDRCHDAANDPRCECDVDVTVERLFTAYRHRTHRARPRRGRGGAARLRLHAAAHPHRRRLGRQRLRGRRPALHQPRQRHRAQPRDERARQPGRPGGHARRDVRAARRAG